MKRVMGFVTLVALVAGCGTGLSELEQKAALEQGAVISDASFQGLSARLQKAMNEVHRKEKKKNEEKTSEEE